VKKPFFLLLLAVSFALLHTTCDKDEDLKGKWTITKLVSSACDDPDDNAVFDFIDGCFEKTGVFGYELCGSMSFTTGTYTLILTEKRGSNVCQRRDDGNYALNGNKVSLCNISTGVCVEGMVNKAKNALIFTEVDDCSQTYTFKKK